MRLNKMEGFRDLFNWGSEMKKMLRGLAVTGVALVSSSAFAYSYCESAYSSLAAGSITMSYAKQNYPECFSATSGAAAQGQLRVTTSRHAQAISDAVTTRFAAASGNFAQLSAVTPGMTGMAAGNQSRWSVWGSSRLTNQDYNSQRASGTWHTASVVDVILGADYQLSPNILLGLSGALDSGDPTIVSNATASTAQLNTSGFSLAPYLGWQISPTLSLDASAGLGRGVVEENGVSKTKSDRSFIAVNLAHTQWFGNYQLMIKGGYQHAEEKFGNIRISTGALGGTSHRNTLGQAKVAAQLGYWVSGVLPYVSLGYINDVERSATPTNSPLGRDALVFQVGANFISLKDNVTAGIVYGNEFGRDHASQRTFSANINVRF